MKKTGFWSGIALGVCVLCAIAATIPYSGVNPNQFGTNGNVLSIKSGASLTNIDGNSIIGNITNVGNVLATNLVLIGNAAIPLTNGASSIGQTNANFGVGYIGSNYDALVQVTNSLKLLYPTANRVAIIGADGIVSNSSVIPNALGTVTSVTVTGDGVTSSATPSSAITTTGTLPISPATASSNNFIAGPVSGVAAALTQRAMTNSDVWFNQITAATVNVVSNTTSETSLLDTNNLLGRTQGIQPGEMVAGRIIEFHLYGFSTQTTGLSVEYRARLGGMAGTVVGDTGSVTGVNITSGTTELYGVIQFLNSTTAVGFICAHFPTVGDKPSSTASVTNYFTITNTVQQQLVLTAQSTTTNFSWQTRAAVIKFY
jgi:hypothetical protein